MLRTCLLVLAFASCVALLAPGSALADDGDSPDGPSLFAYGWDGLWSGATIGFSAGYLATGSVFEDEEWRTLVLGTGIGALVGLGVGVSLAIVDASSEVPYGHYILRDLGYGSLLGLVAGAAVGALVWVDDGSSKDVMIGMAWGTIIGAGVGIVFGVVEGLAAARKRRARAESERGLWLTLGALPSAQRAPALGPLLLGRF